MTRLKYYKYVGCTSLLAIEDPKAPQVAVAAALATDHFGVGLLSHIL